MNDSRITALIAASVDMDRFHDAVSALTEAIAVCIPAIVEAISAAAAVAADIWRLASPMDAYFCPNKRVLHLAWYHPSARIRKKNQKRIRREMARNARRQRHDR